MYGVAVCQFLMYLRKSIASSNCCILFCSLSMFFWYLSIRSVHSRWLCSMLAFKHWFFSFHCWISSSTLSHLLSHVSNTSCSPHSWWNRSAFSVYDRRMRIHFSLYPNCKASRICFNQRICSIREQCNSIAWFFNIP